LVLGLRDFADPLEVDLQTDERGRVRLGELPGVESIVASSLPKGAGWHLREAACAYPDAVTETAGKVVRLPYLGKATSADRSAVSLLESTSGVFSRDAFDRVAIANGFVELRDLAPGDYDLWLKEANARIDVRIVAGEERAGFAVGRDRIVELAGQSPLA